MGNSFKNKILMEVLRAVKDYKLLKDGDKVIVGISGGKDSLALLDLLVKLRRYFFKFEIFAVHVVPEIPGVRDISKKLERHFQRYEGEIIPVIKQMKIPKDSKLHEGIKEAKTCQWCTYARRMTFFKMAEEIGATKVAYGHHKDDIVDTIFLNITNGATLNPMPIFNLMKKGNFAIIRPMAYLRESEIIKYGKQEGLKPLHGCCPLDDVCNRVNIRETVDFLEKKHRGFVDKFFEAYQKKLSFRDDKTPDEEKD